MPGLEFSRGDQVRLLVAVDGVPADTVGTVIGFWSDSGSYLVQFGGWGAHTIPAQSLAAA